MLQASSFLYAREGGINSYIHTRYVKRLLCSTEFIACPVQVQNVSLSVVSSLFEIQSISIFCALSDSHLLMGSFKMFR